MKKNLLTMKNWSDESLVEVDEIVPEVQNNKKLLEKKNELIKCKLCKFKIRSEKSLNTHMIKQHNQCVDCNRTFSKESQLKLHKETNHSIKCNKCEHRATGRKQLDEHNKSLHSRMEFSHGKNKCKTCDFEATNDLELNLHQHQMHKEDKIKCNLCDFRAANEEILKKHYTVAMGHKQNIPCRYFQRGVCRYGNRCKFEHKNLIFSNTSANQPQRQFENTRVRSQQCKFYDQCAKFPNCGFSHFEVCKYQEQCYNPNGCRFVHLDFLEGMAPQRRSH